MAQHAYSLVVALCFIELQYCSITRNFTSKCWTSQHFFLYFLTKKRFIWSISNDVCSRKSAIISNKHKPNVDICLFFILSAPLTFITYYLGHGVVWHLQVIINFRTDSQMKAQRQSRAIAMRENWDVQVEQRSWHQWPQLCALLVPTLFKRTEKIIGSLHMWSQDIEHASGQNSGRIQWLSEASCIFCLSAHSCLNMFLLSAHLTMQLRWSHVLLARDSSCGRALKGGEDDGN